MQTTPASEFIHLGDLIRLLCRSKGSSVYDALDAINQLEGHLKARPFKHVDRYLRELAQLREWLERNSILPGGAAEISEEAAQMFVKVADHLRSTVYSESNGWQMIILNQSAVSEKLRGIERRLRFDDQKALLADTIRCVECGAPRAAIVMGWNLIYEYLRRWIFEDTSGRLARFNALLTTKKRNKSDLYEPIADYEHFQDLGERFVIDLLHDAKLIDKIPYQTLVDALNRRNHFAHPSFAKATDASAAGYIDNLIINVFESTTFAY